MDKSKKILLWVFKIIIFIVLLLCLFLQIQKSGYTQVLLLEWNHERLIALIICFFLMPLNWSVEAVKWRYINKSNGDSISFKQSLGAVVFGACAGMLSPGRWGEPLARAAYLGKNRRSDRIYWNLAGILAQWLVTLFAGFVAFYYYQNQVLNSLAFRLLAFVFMTLLVVLFLWHDRILSRFSQIAFIREFGEFNSDRLKIKNKTKFLILIYTALRFIVYTFQYFILIYVFSINQNASEILMNIFLLFFFQSFSILPGLIDLGVKGNIALAVFHNADIDPTTLVFIIFFIWIVNLFIPALLGYALFYRKFNLLLNEK